MSVERRRALVDRIFSSNGSSAHPIDDDPLFRSWIEQWVAHQIDMDEVRQRYAELRELKHEERRHGNSAPLSRNGEPQKVIATSYPDLPEVESALEAILVSLKKHDENGPDAAQQARPKVDGL
jgi:hypothetical protein